MSLFKDKRLQTGKELKEIAEITRIKQSYLKAIEEEIFSKLPVEVYTKAYIKQYAKYLDVNPEELLARYSEYLSKLTMKNQPELHKNPVIEEKQEIHAEKETTKKSVNYKPIINISLIILTVFIVVSIIIWYQYRQTEIKEIAQYTPPPIESPKETEPPTNNAVSEIKTGSTNSTIDQMLQSSREKSSPLPMPDVKQNNLKYNLNLSATEKVWIQVLIDNKEKKETTLNPGDSISYNANSSFVLLIGNAGGVKINFNGKILENLGKSGSVVKIKLPDDDRQT